MIDRRDLRADRHRSLVPGPAGARSSRWKTQLRAIGDWREVDDATAARGQAVRLLRPAAGHDLRHDARWRSASDARSRGIVATFKAVDTCAAEFEAYTPYYYSTYEDEDETPPKRPAQRRIMILGGGPNRIGQGIEFDYCCCHASFALREMGIESIMVNSNPETVSTDYDTSDLLFFEPLTTEDVLNICDRVQPDGVIVQFGGQTPLNLARALATAGVPIIGTSVDTIEAAEDREKFQQLLERLGLQAAGQWDRPQPWTRPAPKRRRSAIPRWCGPVSCWAAGPWKSATTRRSSSGIVAEAFIVAQGQPVLIDRFLEDATEVDVDAICDGERCRSWRASWNTSKRRASTRAIRPVRFRRTACPDPSSHEIREATARWPSDLNVVGLMNVQFAVKKEDGRPNVYVLGSQSAGQPHRSVCGQGDRRAGRQDRRQGHGRHDAGRTGRHRASRFRRTCRSRKASFRSASSPASTSCSARKCGAPAK